MFLDFKGKGFWCSMYMFGALLFTQELLATEAQGPKFDFPSFVFTNVY